MNLAGYSGKPLVEKLGYKPGDSVCLFNGPAWFNEELTESGIMVTDDIPATWVHCFFRTQKELVAFCENFNLSQIEKGLWTSWPKKSSGIETELTEQMFRDYILPLGWVDIKVAAIDNEWSGLKFTRRRAKETGGKIQ